MESRIIKSEEALYDAYLTETESIRAEILRLEFERKSTYDGFKKEKEIMLVEGGEQSHELQKKIDELEEQIENINKNFEQQKQQLLDSVYLSEKQNKELKEKKDKKYKGKHLAARIGALIGVPLVVSLPATIKYVNDISEASYNAATEYLSEHPGEHVVPLEVTQSAVNGVFPYGTVIYYAALAAVSVWAFGPYFYARHQIKKNAKKQKEVDAKIKELDVKREVEVAPLNNEIVELQKKKQAILPIERAEGFERIEKECFEACESIGWQIEQLTLKKNICYNNYLMKMSMQGSSYAQTDVGGKIIKLGKPERYQGKIDEMKQKLTTIESKMSSTSKNTALSA